MLLDRHYNNNNNNIQIKVANSRCIQLAYGFDLNFGNLDVVVSACIC